MNKPRKEIIATILEHAGSTNDEHVRERIERMLNHWYFHLCRMHSYLSLEEDVNLAFSGSGSSGKILPADCVGINSVRDETNHITFYPADAAHVSPKDKRYRFYVKTMQREALVVGTDGTLTHGSSSFLSPDLATDNTGEYIQFGTEPGLYKLIASLAFEPKYWGPDYGGASMEYFIRPRDTKTLFLVDPDNDLHTNSTVSVNYWRLPSPLYLDGHRPVLPSAQALELQILRELPEAKARRPVSQSELDKAIALCEALDEEQQRFRPVVGATGFRIDMGANQAPFGDRDDDSVGYPVMP